MTLYLEFFKKAFRQKRAYRFDFYMSIFSTILSLVVQISVWKALYNNAKSINSITLNDMINYVIINLIVAALTSSQVGNKIGDKVEDGSIISDFIRPVTFKYYLMAEDLGSNSVGLLFNVVPTCLIAILIFNIKLIIHPSHMPIFLVSLILGITISYYINYILGLLAFWLKTSYYIKWFLAAFYELFAGSFIPLWFYPSTLLKICNLLPFRLICFEPISIYLGKTSYQSSINIIILQFVWILVLIALEKAMWLKVQSKIIINGG